MSSSTMVFFRHAIASCHPIVRTVPPRLRGEVFDRIFYSPKHNFVYFRVPKSANSTIVLNLAHAMNVKTLGDRGSKVKKIGKRNLKMALLSRERLKNCYKFTFIRNPFSRVLSAYLDKIEPGKTKFRNDLDINDRELSFLEFLKLLDDGYLTSNIHWAPQAYVVPQHPSKLDFIGRVENLEADLQEVMTHTNLH